MPKVRTCFFYEGSCGLDRLLDHWVYIVLALLSFFLAAVRWVVIIILVATSAATAIQTVDEAGFCHHGEAIKHALEKLDKINVINIEI